jgi:Flp pilus assembly protein TadD
MLDRPQRYPLLRRQRRARPWRRWRAMATGRALRIGAAVLVVGAVIALIVRLAAGADLPDPQAAMAQGRAALARGNYSAARNHFIDAVTAEPANGAAQLALARAYLLLEDGVAADGTLDRARAAGVPARDLQVAQGEALLLQGDADGALAAAGRAAGDDARRLRARALAAKGDRAAAIRALRAMVAADTRDAAALRDLGRVLFDNGDIGWAAEAAARAAALAPRDPAALTLRGEVVRSRYGLVAALPWFEAALRRDAYFHPALIEYAGTLGDGGRYADSLGAARRASAARPGSPQALYLMAVIAARAGNTELAAALLDKTAGALDGLPGGVLLSGGLDYAAGRYEQAVAKWRALVAMQPMNLVARRLLGAALLRSGDAAGALAALRPAALRADADPYTLALVARAFEAQGQRAWAARFLNRAAFPSPPAAAPFGQDDGDAVLDDAVADAPDDPGAAVAWIRGRLERGEGATALAAAQRIARVSPGAPAAQLLLGDVLAAQGRGREAVAPYARAADLRFDRPAMLRLVEALGMSGDAKRAAAVLAFYIAQNPEDVAARRALANLELAAGDGAAAADTLESLRADLGGRDAALLVQLAQAWTDAGDPAAALPYARAAYRLQPMSAGTADAYGWALYARGDRSGAMQLLAKAVAISPRDATANWHHAQALAEMGRTAAARQAIAVALADPAFGERVVASRLLASLR